MSLTHAWLSLQLMPLIVDQTLSSLELPTFPDLPCLQAYDVTWNTQCDQPSGLTPEASRSVDIKPSPSPPDFSGGGSTLATMSLTHAWLSLQRGCDLEEMSRSAMLHVGNQDFASTKPIHNENLFCLVKSRSQRRKAKMVGAAGCFRKEVIQTTSSYLMQ
ncbi:hypothetical protein MRX96_036918 [Rhipicephalus microplus]